MILGIWLSDWPYIRPEFTTYLEDECLLELVKNIIVDFLKTLDLEPPANLDSFIEKGYERARRLYEMWKEETSKLFKR